MPWVINLLLLAAGLVALRYGSEWLVSGSVALARRLKVPELVIGLTIVSIGTSAPELVTRVVAALKGETGLVLGNACGANIANLSLVLGIGALVGRIPVGKRVAFIDKPLTLAVTLLAALLMLDGRLNWSDGVLLMLAWLGLTLYALKGGEPDYEDEVAEALLPRTWRSVLLLCGGLAVLAGGAEVLVRGATGIAGLLGISGTAVGATIVSVGTCAPEIAATLTAARSGRYSLLLGNIIGSCQFNLTAILGLPALLRPLQADPSVLQLHLPALVLVTIWGLVIMHTAHRTVLRREGAISVALFAAYAMLTFTLH